GAVEGPANYLHAGIDVGRAVGWGLIKPERPDPRFRITQQNVLVVGWGHNATSAAFADVNGDGKPDVVLVSPGGGGAVVKFFLNHAGKFNAQPDHELKVPTVSKPHRIRVALAQHGPQILVAGQTAALLKADGAFPNFRVLPFDLGDGNHLRFLDDNTPLVARRFGGFYSLDVVKDESMMRTFCPEITGPYRAFLPVRH